MIRFMDGTLGHPTPERLARRVKGRAAVAAGVGVIRERVRAPKTPRTNIVRCFSCMRAYRLHTHEPMSCARQRGIDGNTLYTRAREDAR